MIFVHIPYDNSDRPVGPVEIPDETVLNAPDSLSYLRALVGGGYLERVVVHVGLEVWVDEEFNYRPDRADKVNSIATELVRNKVTLLEDVVYGDVFVATSNGPELASVTPNIIWRIEAMAGSRWSEKVREVTLPWP